MFYSKVSPILFLIYCILAIDDTGFGSLFVIDKNNHIMQGVTVSAKRLMVAERAKVFNFNTDGELKKFPSGDFVGLDETGMFVVDKKPSRHWELRSTDSFIDKRHLSYSETTEFTACRDGSIGVKRKCPGARIVFLHYLDFAEVSY